MEIQYEQDLLSAFERDHLPRLVALTINPEELAAYALEIIELWERLIEEEIINKDLTPDMIAANFPHFAPACNGKRHSYI